MDAMTSAARDFTRLEPSEIEGTASRLVARVGERFPGSGLGRVAARVNLLCRETQARTRRLERPHWVLRSLSLLLATLAIATIGALGFGVQWSRFLARFPSPIGSGEGFRFTEFLEFLEPSLGSLVFLVAFLVFALRLEERWKQRRVLAALNELRSLSHVIDMHQLTKDPDRLTRSGGDTESSPKRVLSAFELGRYLDYCGEMLSVLSKVAALYAQAFPEPVVLSSVDQIETLTSGLSTKIDLKLSRLDRIEARFPELAGAVGARADEKRVAAAPHQPEAAKASAARGGRALVMAPQPGTAKTSDARGGRALVMAPQPETAKTSVALGAPPRTAAPGSGSPAPPSKPLLDAPATAGAASGARRRLPLAKAPSPRPQAASDGRAAGEAKDD